MKRWWRIGGRFFFQSTPTHSKAQWCCLIRRPPKKSLRRLSRDKDDGVGTTVCPMLKKKKRSSTVIPHTIIVASFELCFKSHRRPREQMVGSFFTTPIALLSGLYSAGPPGCSFNESTTLPALTAAVFITMLLLMMRPSIIYLFIHRHHTSKSHREVEFIYSPLLWSKRWYHRSGGGGQQRRQGWARSRVTLLFTKSSNPAIY